MIRERDDVQQRREPASQDVLRHYWHPVARAGEVADRPLGVRLLDEPLVLWRSGGQVVAFHDLCIHRGTPLSLGWIDDGQLVCAYHGWCYGADGACTRIPAIPAERGIPRKARAVAYQVQERHGLVWVCLDEPRADIPAFPPEIDDPAYRWEVYSSDGVWQANVARMVENLADYSHFAWVHPGTLGDRAHPETPDVTIEPIAGGFTYEIVQAVNRLRPEAATIQRFQVIMPFMIVIQRFQPGGTERQTNVYVFTPISPKATRFFRLSGRNYRDQLPDEELNRRHQLTFEQDRVIVEAQRPEALPLDLAEELHLRGPDTPAIEYRRRLREMGVGWEWSA
jgi:phenylpropionate dioxygenase-like ring-hydroxylating dioxygenase large terminal subunit